MFSHVMVGSNDITKSPRNFTMHFSQRWVAPKVLSIPKAAFFT